jgi:hypothetical protein
MIRRMHVNGRACRIQTEGTSAQNHILSRPHKKKSQGRFVKKNFAVCKSFSDISVICIHEQTSGLQRTRKKQDGFLEVDARNDKTST